MFSLAYKAEASFYHRSAGDVSIVAFFRNQAERIVGDVDDDARNQTPGSDFLLNCNNEIFCLEANTLPGMTPTSLLPQEAAVLGINFNQLCEKLIEISLNKYTK